VGLTNMGDRLDAIGGALVISSKLGAGTTISGSVRVPSRVMVGV
jgi:signal transduction histidine kinase